MCVCMCVCVLNEWECTTLNRAYFIWQNFVSRWRPESDLTGQGYFSQINSCTRFKLFDVRYSLSLLLLLSLGTMEWQAHSYTGWQIRIVCLRNHLVLICRDQWDIIICLRIFAHHGNFTSFPIRLVSGVSLTFWLIRKAESYHLLLIWINHHCPNR